MEGIPRDIFSEVETMKKIGLDVPQVTEICYELKKAGINIDTKILNVRDGECVMSIKIENLTHVYMPKSPFEKKALDNVNLVIEDGEFLALIGHTGSGKSTLIQHLNGLLEPTSGRILVDDIDITNKEAKLTEIRKKIGLVFQYPEYQLFEETIEKDIAFGPNNLELSSEEVSRRVKKSMEMVGLDYETYKNVSPLI